MTSTQGDLLGMLQKSARNGTLLSSCEPEIRELMHQIDVLITGKHTEWAGKWAGLETQLREKERELAAVRHTLWQRDTELAQVNEKYEQLKTKRQQKPSSSQSVSVRKTTEEINQLRHDKQLLEDAKAQLEQEKMVLESQLNLAKLEGSALQEKCAALEGEVKFCRSQLDQKDSLLAATEQSSSVRTKQLQAQLKRAQEQAESRDIALQKLRAECEERRREAEAASAEVLSLNSQLSHSQASVRAKLIQAQLMDKLSQKAAVQRNSQKFSLVKVSGYKQLRGKYAELQTQVQKLEDQVKVTGGKLTQREQSMKLMQESSQRKDKLIKSLGGRQGSEVNRLKKELSQAQSQLQTRSQRERELRNELATLRQRSAADGQELARLTAKCASQDERLAQELASLNARHSTELKELRSQLSKMAKEKTLEMEQMEAECEARLARQQKLLEERLKSATHRPTATEQSASKRTSPGSGKAPKTNTQKMSAPSTAHRTTKYTFSSTSPQSHEQETPSISHTAPHSAAIVGKFLREADQIAHQSQPQHHSSLKPSTAPGKHSELVFEYQSQEDMVSGSLPFPLSTPKDTSAGSFVPLQPVSVSKRCSQVTSAPENAQTSSAVGGVVSEGTGDQASSVVRDAVHKDGRDTREVRESALGVVEGERSNTEPHKLEELFSKTLDGIVDRHFERLDSSLMKLLAQDS